MQGRNLMILLLNVFLYVHSKDKKYYFSKEPQVQKKDKVFPKNAKCLQLSTLVLCAPNSNLLQILTMEEGRSHRLNINYLVLSLFNISTKIYIEIHEYCKKTILQILMMDEGGKAYIKNLLFGELFL